MGGVDTGPRVLPIVILGVVRLIGFFFQWREQFVGSILWKVQRFVRFIRFLGLLQRFVKRRRVEFGAIVQLSASEQQCGAHVFQRLRIANFKRAGNEWLIERFCRAFRQQYL